MICIDGYSYDDLKELFRVYFSVCRCSLCGRELVKDFVVIGSQNYCNACLVRRCGYCDCDEIIG